VSNLKLRSSGRNADVPDLDAAQGRHTCWQLAATLHEAREGATNFFAGRQDWL